MPITRVRVLRVSLALGTAIAAATLSLVAQRPAPGAQPLLAPLKRTAGRRPRREDSRRRQQDAARPPQGRAGRGGRR